MNQFPVSGSAATRKPGRVNLRAHNETDAAHLLRILQTRLAEVYYQRGDYQGALPWANRTVAADAAQAGRDRALYVRGAVFEKQYRSREAQAGFDALLAAYPRSLLRTAAHEELALTAEDLGQLGDSPRIVREHPQSLTAPFALYRAACCARKLASFNDWWRGNNPNHFKEASRLIKRLAREYPDHPLAHHARRDAVFYLEGGFH